ncbi:SERINE/ARGININE RICH SPLICING FACTOR [Salix koriyanagi]|uniref:SERINE/ARGININE RICH SPLICING FACTOR n=1 Tax=Salix koriyanagi TaxID=2511006 RepID=A0A9Q0WQQ4_9ROSI|nr:SERINE/ARGININE RICH SPLICING FACTOR [Salix koriyanagi]
MSRYRSRSRSYSPGRRSRTPPRASKRYDDEDRHLDTRSYRDRRSSAPSGLLIRNLSLDARPEDLRGPFEKFGPLKDIYLPRNYHTREPRGFGFVKYRYGEDAAEAKRQMNHKSIGGREISIVFAEENRKTPQEMCRTIRTSNRHGGSHRGRTPPGSIRQQYHFHGRMAETPRKGTMHLSYGVLKRLVLGECMSEVILECNGKSGDTSSAQTSKIVFFYSIEDFALLHVVFRAWM